MTTNLPPDTGPVTLPPDPERVAASRVADLASAGLTHRPPIVREYQLAACNVAIEYQPQEALYAVLNHLEDADLEHLMHATHYLRGAIRWLQADRRERGLAHD